MKSKMIIHRYSKKCPFCKTMNTTILGANIVCDCGSKYYFFEKFWLNRNTGEKVVEKEIGYVKT